MKRRQTEEKLGGGEDWKFPAKIPLIYILMFELIKELNVDFQIHRIFIG